MEFARHTASRLALGVAALPVVAGTAMAGTDGWALLASIGIEEIETATDYRVVKTFPSEIENGVERFDITGFAVPVSDDPDIREFIIVSDMGFCPFCGSAEHGTSLVVRTVDPVGDIAEGQRVTVRGTLEPVRDPGTLMSAIMREGRILRR